MPVTLINFLQALILPNSVLHVNHVVPGLQIAEVREKRRDLRLLPLRTRRHRLRFVIQIARAKDDQVRIRQHDAVRNVSLRQRRGQHLARKIAGLVGVALAAPRAAAQTERNVVLGENLSQPLDFPSVRSRKQHLLALAVQLLHLFKHRRNRAMEARRRLRQKSDCFRRLPRA